VSPDVLTVAPRVVRQYTAGDTQVVYVGEAQALAAAGLVEECQLPGQPGNATFSLTLDADGVPLPRYARHKRGHHPGKRSISIQRKGGRTLFRLVLCLSPAETQALLDEREAEPAAAACGWPFPLSAHTPVLEAA